MKDKNGDEFVVGNTLQIHDGQGGWAGLLVEVTYLDPFYDCFTCRQLKDCNGAKAGAIWQNQPAKAYVLVKESVMSFKVGDVVEVIKNEEDSGTYGNFLGWHLQVTKLTDEFVWGNPTFKASVKSHADTLRFPRDWVKPVATPTKIGEMVVVFKKGLSGPRDKFDFLMKQNGATFKETYMDGPHDKFVYEINSAAALSAAQNSSSIYSMTWFPGV